MRRVLLPFLLVAVGALGACGEDSEPVTISVKDAAPRAGQTTTSSGASAATRPADKKIAEAALLRLSDLPEGWEETDSEDESTDSPCGAIQSAKDATTARASSNDFTNSIGGQASSTVYLYDDDSDAGRFYAGMITADTRRCLGQAVADGIREATPDVELADPVTSVVNTAARGDETHTQRLEFTATQREVERTLTITLTYTRVGRGITLLYLQETDDVVLSTGTDAAARRLSDALAD